MVGAHHDSVVQIWIFVLFGYLMLFRDYYFEFVFISLPLVLHGYQTSLVVLF